MSESLVFDMSGNSKSAEAAFMKLIKENERLKKSIADVNKEITKGAKAGDSWLKGPIGDLKAMAIGMFSVTTLMSGAARVAGAWHAEMTKVKIAYQDVEKSIVKTVSAAGDARSGAKIEAFLENIKGATKAQGAAAFGGVTAATPLMGLDKRLAIAGQIAPLAPTGADLGQTGNIAAKLAEILPQKSAGDIADLTVGMQQRLGEDLSKVGGDKFLAQVARLQQEGVRPERALGMAAAAVEAHLPVADAMDAALSNKPVRSREEAKQRAEFRKTLAIMGNGAEQEAFFTRAQNENLAQQRVADLGGFRAGQQAAAQQAFELGDQPFQLQMGEQLSKAERARQFVMTKVRESGNQKAWGSRFIQDNFLRGAEMAASFTGADPAEAVLNAAGGKSSLISGIQGFTPKDADQFRKQEAELAQAIRENTAALKNRGKKNIDAHIE